MSVLEDHTDHSVNEVLRSVAEKHGLEGERILRACSPGTKLVSFDVFETVATRKIGEPEAVFYQVGKILQNRGLMTSSAEVFAHTRRECERRARSNSRSQEISLHEIYEEMSHCRELKGKIDEYVSIEMEVERETITVISSMKEVVSVVRGKIGRVAFVSDMYLPQQFLEELLVESGLMVEGDVLYVSSQYGLQKFRTGDLFAKVLEKEGLRPGELLHCGNSSISDIQPAKQLGIQTVFFEEGNANASERLLNQHAEKSEGVGALLGGVSRLARLHGIGLEDDLRVIWDIGTTVTGPLVYLYAQWVVEHARSLGLNTLLFLARDAYFPYLAVKELLRRHPEYGIESRYLYGSRPTYYALSIDELGEEEWSLLTGFGGQSYTTLTNLTRSMLVSEEAMKSLLPDFRLTGEDWNRELTEEELSRIKKVVLYDPRVNRVLLDEIKEYQSTMREYFSDLGVEASSRVALVDTGWTTRSHQPLFEFVSGIGCADVRLFYVGLTGSKMYIPEEKIETFMFNQASGRGRWHLDFSYARPMESLLIAAHGRTEGFEHGGEAEGVTPVYAPLENSEFIRRYYSHYQAAVEHFVVQLEEEKVACDPMHDLASVAEKILRRFWDEPNADEARLWSQLSWEWDPLGSRKYALARPYVFADLLETFKTGRWPECYAQFWVGGAKVLSAPWLLLVMQAVMLLRKGLGWLARKLPEPMQQSLEQILAR